MENSQLTQNELLTAFLTNPYLVDPAYHHVGSTLWPYDIGMEIECNMEKHYDKVIFESLQGIKAVDTDSEEQRYRITNGYEGFKALWNLTKLLHEFSIINLQAGIHYHNDLTNYYDLVKGVPFKEYNFVLDELDSWNYPPGRYNEYREVSEYKARWVRFDDVYKTVEYRIGEQTFDYSLLAKRIIHVNALTQKMINVATIYNMKIVEIKPEPTHDEIKNLVNSRIIRL